MAQIMSPSEVDSEITDGQIDKAADAYRAMLRKHRKELTSSAVQQMLTQDSYVGEQVGVLRKWVQTIVKMFVRLVRPDRERSPQQVVDATGRAKYIDDDVVKTMPRGEGEETELIFFPGERTMTDDELDKEFDRRGLKPADAYSLAKANEDDPALADTKPNATHWKDANGKWCYLAFCRWLDDERHVDVYRYDRVWYDSWWFAGVSK